MATPTKPWRNGASTFAQTDPGSTSAVPSVPSTPGTPTTAAPSSLPSTSSRTAERSGSATTAAGQGGSPAISPDHAKRLAERGLNPLLCAKLGVHTIDKGTLGFHYVVGGQTHNTKLRRGKGNMPWKLSNKPLVLWNVDCLRDDPQPDEEVIITEGEFDAIACIQAGFNRVVSVPNGAQAGSADSPRQGFEYLFAGKELHPDLQKFGRFVLATDSDRRGTQCRDALAVRLGDERCRWVRFPQGLKDANDVLRERGATELAELIHAARPMWTDEVCLIDDEPDPPEDEQRYRLGITGLDVHGLRVTLPALMVLLGPYSSGKSVLLRQLLCNFWRMHGWRALLTSFEERIKPRYQRDLRRHFIGRASRPEAPWTLEELAKADEEVRNGFVFLKRGKGRVMTPDLLLDRIIYAVRLYGVRVVTIDPVNEISMRPPIGTNKTDFIGDFLMELKDVAEDYGLLVIVVAHVSKEGRGKLASKRALLTMNDGEDTRHWGGKSDIGMVMWRHPNAPSLLHIERTKDHETMGRPTLAELELDRGLNAFEVTRLGYDILKGAD